MLPLAVRDGVIEKLRSKLGDNTSFRNYTPASGGCINNGGRFETSAGIFFVKWNDREKFPGMFQAEAKGLELLRECEAIDVPTVILHATSHSYQFLVLNFINGAAKNSNYWTLLGERLAALHYCSAGQFGLPENNYIGALQQHNHPTDGGWARFFVERRLEPQLQLCLQKGLSDRSLRKDFETLFKKLEDILIPEIPTLVHGDLWSGNVMVNSSGEPTLIDPAVYYGHREIDLAMTFLFGGFSSDFYEAYRNQFPLQSGFRERFEIYNLYPLMVHVNLFGGHYLQQVRATLKKYS